MLCIYFLKTQLPAGLLLKVFILIRIICGSHRPWPIEKAPAHLHACHRIVYTPLFRKSQTLAYSIQMLAHSYRAQVLIQGPTANNRQQHKSLTTRQFSAEMPERNDTLLSHHKK